MSQPSPIPADALGAVITGDPAESMTAQEEARLQFLPRLFHHSIEPGSGGLRDMRDMDGVLLHMHFGAENPAPIDGSAAMVAPGVALCAMHVLRPHIAAIASGAGVLCVGIARSGPQFWRLHTITEVPETDLAIVGLSYSTTVPSDSTFSLSSITTRLPRIGERITLTGFKAHRLDHLPEHNAVVAHGEVVVSVGEVTAQYPTGRDRVMLPWPALEVDCQAWGGMSGGPAFDASGHLVGLVCSSFTAEDGMNSPSYVSLLWPALAKQYEGGWPLRASLGTRTLLPSANRRVCQIDRPEAVWRDGDQVRYRPWS